MIAEKERRLASLFHAAEEPPFFRMAAFIGLTTTTVIAMFAASMGLGACIRDATILGRTASCA
jgi:hypothetical protein